MLNTLENSYFISSQTKPIQFKNNVIIDYCQLNTKNEIIKNEKKFSQKCKYGEWIKIYGLLKQQ